MFSNDALFKKPAFVNASPVPLAVPSQPPPAPPPIKKCYFSTANELVDENRRKAENKTEIKVLISFIISSLIIFMKSSLNISYKF